MLEKDSSKRATLEDLNKHPFITCKNKLEGPLQLNVNEELKYQKEESNVPENDETPFPDSENFENRIELKKKALHNHPENEGDVNQNDTSGINLTGGVALKVWVVKWADYSSKYGMGYLLSNGHVGAYFNDKTKILLSPKGNKFMYSSFDEEGLESTK